MFRLKILSVCDDQSDQHKYEMIWLQVVRNDPVAITFTVAKNRWGQHVMDCPVWNDLLKLCPSIEVLPGAWAQNIRISVKDLIYLKLLLEN
jgi:hypothetical protein